MYRQKAIRSESGFLKFFSFECLLLSFSLMCRFNTNLISSPSSSKGFVLVILSQEVLREEFEFILIFFSDFSEGDTGGGLLVNKSSESFLILDKGEGDFLFSTELGQPKDEFDGVDVMGNKNQFGFFVFNEGGHVVKSEFKNNGFFGFLGGSSRGLGVGGFSKSGSLLGLGFGLVFTEESEKSLGLFSGESVGELVNGGGDLQSSHEDSLLSLEKNVSRPSDESGKVSLGLQVTSNSEVSGSGFEEGVSLDSSFL